MCFIFLGMPASMGTMSRSDSAFTMSSMTLGGRSESVKIQALFRQSHEIELLGRDSISVILFGRFR